MNLFDELIFIYKLLIKKIYNKIFFKKEFYVFFVILFQQNIFKKYLYSSIQCNSIHNMKFIFVKNLKNNNICNKIFEHLETSNYRNRPGTKSFIKDFKKACLFVDQEESYVIGNIA